MAKNAYLVASDLHLNYKNLRGRINYRDECLAVCKELIRIASEYKNKGYTVTLLLLGDVFNRSYNDIFNACNDNNFFYMWALHFGKIYSVLGNHELSYYSANPFYTLVSDIESERVKMIMNRVWRPVGSSGVISIVDSLTDGNVVFKFNHYGTGVLPAEDGKVNIGLFHQNLVSEEIVKASESRFGTSTFVNAVDVERIGIFDGYDYCFLGHMHTVYGTFKTDNGTVLCYLASLGRTNVNEVNDSFLERNIPVICVDDGVFAGAFDNLITLPSRKECVRESQVQMQKQKAQVEAERKQIKESVSLCDDAIKNVHANLSDNVLATSIFDGLLENPIDTYGQEIITHVTDALSKYLI